MSKSLEAFKRKLESAYSERLIKGPKDYPPFALTPFEDRARYHAFVLKLVETEKEFAE